jgi:F0F1-type ATP synthase delta subunit
MKLPEQYARVLTQRASQKDDQEFNTFFASFIDYLKAHHHEKLLPRILSAVQRISSSSAATNHTIITVGKAEDEQNFTQLITAHADTFGHDAEVRVNPHIVGGIIIRNRTHLLDESYRARLIELYNTLRK